MLPILSETINISICRRSLGKNVMHGFIQDKLCKSFQIEHENNQHRYRGSMMN